MNWYRSKDSNNYTKNKEVLKKTGIINIISEVCIILKKKEKVDILKVKY